MYGFFGPQFTPIQQVTVATNEANQRTASFGTGPTAEFLAMLCFNKETVDHSSVLKLSQTTTKSEAENLEDAQMSWGEFADTIQMKMLPETLTVWRKMYEMEQQIRQCGGSLSRQTDATQKKINSLEAGVRRLKHTLRLLHGWYFDPTNDQQIEDPSKKYSVVTSDPDVGGYLNVCFMFWFRVLLLRNEHELAQRFSSQFAGTHRGGEDANVRLCEALQPSSFRFHATTAPKPETNLPQALHDYFTKGGACNVYHIVQGVPNHFDRFNRNVVKGSIDELVASVYYDPQDGALAHLARYNEFLCSLAAAQCDAGKIAKLRDNFQRDVQGALTLYSASVPLTDLRKTITEVVGFAETFVYLNVAKYNKDNHQVRYDYSSGTVTVDTTYCTESMLLAGKITGGADLIPVALTFKCDAATNAFHHPFLFARVPSAIIYLGTEPTTTFKKEIKDAPTFYAYCSEYLAAAVLYHYHPTGMTVAFAKPGTGTPATAAKLTISGLAFAKSPLKAGAASAVEFDLPEYDSTAGKLDDYKAGIDKEKWHEHFFDRMGKVWKESTAKVFRNTYELARLRRDAPAEFDDMFGAKVKPATTPTSLVPTREKGGTPTEENQNMMGMIATYTQTAEGNLYDARRECVAKCFGGAGTLTYEKMQALLPKFIEFNDKTIQPCVDNNMHENAFSALANMLRTVAC